MESRAKAFSVQTRLQEPSRRHERAQRSDLCDPRIARCPGTTCGDVHSVPNVFGTSQIPKPRCFEISTGGRQDMLLFGSDLGPNGRSRIVSTIHLYMFVDAFFICSFSFCRHGRGRAARRSRRPLELLGHANARSLFLLHPCLLILCMQDL